VELYLGECFVSWLSKKQSSVSLSTVETEYVAAASCCTQVLWMKQTLKDIQVEYDEPIPIYCDNTSAIGISKNPVMHSKLNNIPIKYHFIHEYVAEKNIIVEYVGRKEQVVDIFTKPILRESFSPNIRSNFYSQMNSFECLSYMSYIYMSKHHKEDSSGWGSSFRKSSIRGSNPEESSVRGRIPQREVTFSIDVKGGEIYHMQDKDLYA
jgi:hypothetical protein